MIERLARFLEDAEHAIVFTGAGVSAESGIPTFRGRGGLWERFDPQKLATPEGFWEDPMEVWSWYKLRMELIARARPNPAHVVIARLQERGLVKTIITQNIDGLHQRAGARDVVELHGNIWRVRCTGPGCRHRETLAEPPEEIPPRCPACGSLLRPDVVWFGEPLPFREWSRAVEEAERADLVLVVGTSGVVMPAGMIPYIVKRNGGVLVEINVEETGYTQMADLHIRGKAGEVLAQLGGLLGIYP